MRKNLTHGLPSARSKADDEAAPFMRVRNHYHKLRNEIAIIKIQTRVRGFLTRAWYKEYHKRKMWAIVKIQRFLKHRQSIKSYKNYIKNAQMQNVTKIQKFLRGYPVHKKYKKILQDNLIERLMAYYRVIRIRE